MHLNLILNLNIIINIFKSETIKLFPRNTSVAKSDIKCMQTNTTITNVNCGGKHSLALDGTTDY